MYIETVLALTAEVGGTVSHSVDSAAMSAATLHVVCTRHDDICQGGWVG